jgi:hypothetical protein
LFQTHNVKRELQERLRIAARFFRPKTFSDLEFVLAVLTTPAPDHFEPSHNNMFLSHTQKFLRFPPFPSKSHSENGYKKLMQALLQRAKEYLVPNAAHTLTLMLDTWHEF